MLQGKLSGPIQSDSDVINYFSSNRQAHGLVPTQNKLKLVKKTSDDLGKQHYLLQQQYQGLPVYGKYITAHVGTNMQMYAITNDSSTELDGISIDIQPTIDAAQAASTFQLDVEKEAGYSITLGGQFASRELEKPKTELMVYPFNGNYYLAYRIDLEYIQPTLDRWIGFVDAHTGAVLKKFSRMEQAASAGSATGTGSGYYGTPRIINITKNQDMFYLTDKTKPMYRIENGSETGVIETYDDENPFFPIGSSTTTFADSEAVDAHYFAGQVYDFYAERYNRNSLDGKGMSIISVVNAGAIDNAFWDGHEIVYGDGKQQFECLTCANDVIAHELTHAVTEYSANLEYSGQSGALNESISDIMAAVFDSQDWAIGEDTGIAGGNGVLRDLERPDRGMPSQPSSMSGYVNLAEDAEHDNGGVHLNSGIPNHAAYLIAKGIDALPALQGQGRALLGQITYGALTSYLTPTSGFEAARDSFVLAAGDLVLPDEQKNAIIAVVKDSWATVGLPYTNNENNIVSLSVSGMEGKPDINVLAHTVTFKVKYGTKLNELIPHIGISPGATISPGTSVPQNFASPVTYTITSQNGQPQTWTVQGKIADPESLNDIVGFNADVLTGPAIIDSIQHKVTLYVEAADDVTSVQPSIELSKGATVSPASGATANLSQPVTYTVTAENGTTQQWIVTAVKDSSSPKVLGAVSLQSTVVAVVFDHPMDFSTLGNAANYKLESLISSYSNPQITKVEVDCQKSNIVYLTTSALVSQNGYKLTVTNLKGTNGYGIRPDSTMGYFLTDDTVQPVISTARIKGKQLALTFNEYIQGAYGASISTFKVEVNNAVVQVDSITSVGRRVLLTLSKEVSQADRVNVSYVPSPYVGEVTDLSGNIIPSFSKLEVINRTNSSKPSAGAGWVQINNSTKQIIKHPTKPVIYAIFGNSYEVVAANIETGATKTITLDRQPERVYVSGGKLYVALVDQPHSYDWWKKDQTGSIAILNEETLQKMDQFNVPIDPFDIVVDANGIIYVSSGSGQWTNFTSFSSITKSLIDNVTIRQRSYLQYSSPNRIYSIDTDSSPRDISAYNLNSSGQFTDPKSIIGGYDSPYHGDYPMSTFLQISPDNKYLFNGAGTIFTSAPVKANDMIYVRTIEAFNSIVFSDDLTKFYTLSGQTLRIYNYATFALEKQIAMPYTAFNILPGYKSDELLVAYRENGGTTIVTYSLKQSSPTIARSQSIAEQPAVAAAAANVTINACPITTGGGSNGGGGSTGGGGGFIPGGGGGGGMVVVTPTPTIEPTVTLDPNDLSVTKGVDSKGNTEIFFKPDPDKLQQAFLDAQKGVNLYEKEHGGTVVPKIIIPVGGLDHSLTVELPASTFIQANKIASKAIIVVQSSDITYELPVQALNGDNLIKAWGSDVNLDSIRIKLVIEKIDSSLSDLIRKQLVVEGFKALTDSINFAITLDKQGISKEMTDFNGIYVTRSFTLNTKDDASHITALVYDAETKTSGFVPAFVRKEGEKTILDIKAPHNSIYTVASSFKSFKDMDGHWAKNDIEIMASKKIVLGITDTEFNPDKKVTRAEFAALLVRSLGLAIPQTSSLRFIDVEQKAWYARTVSVAAQTGLITGDPKGRFAPDGIITRQEMAVMIGRAIKYVRENGNLENTDKKAINTDTLKDSTSIPKWAAEDIKDMLERGIMESGMDGKFEPALPVTRANAVVALKRMLQQLSFISK
ncbi:hypothetical protein Back11_45640 [Paenibacillus baekrokdamisoli]|uniref:SLH domain-containing protein n=2 Tax=Paenibacillus baekrokdamisoli TaxID=1712516 RepID=A0A3G9JJM2_9BACL|nr:hypothetical protein Back11_45640 [Paenibacillus baekrokdamisoli]